MKFIELTIISECNKKKFMPPEKRFVNKEYIKEFYKYDDTCSCVIMQTETNKIDYYLVAENVSDLNFMLNNDKHSNNNFGTIIHSFLTFIWIILLIYYLCQ